MLLAWLGTGPARAAETTAPGVLASKALAAALASPTAASSRDTPGDQPLPGYTISNPKLDPIGVGGQTTLVLQGTYNHGDLVMWAHGYRGQDYVLTTEAHRFGLRAGSRPGAGHGLPPRTTPTASTDLVNWVGDGMRPAGDDLTTRATVATPTYGCRFSDQNAYTSGTGTRRLYAACS